MQKADASQGRPTWTKALPQSEGYSEKAALVEKPIVFLQPSRKKKKSFLALQSRTYGGNNYFSYSDPRSI